jgi:hypothetical protein
MNESIDNDLKNFNCVDFFREVKNRMSAELNTMTPEERHLYFEKINDKAQQKFEKYNREREKVR